jgi:flagellar hook assembly protein FlgD
MLRTTLLITALCAVGAQAAGASTFAPAPLLPGAGVDVLDRAVTRERVQRDLFGNPWATTVVGHVDVYDRFPYLESRYFQVVSDASWNRLLVGELDGRLAAWNGSGSAFGALSAPRGLDSDARGRVYVADSGNRRVLAFDVVTEFDQITLVPRFAVTGLARPYDVAHSDAGTPFDYSDDRLYVADAGASRVLRYDLSETGAVLRAAVGELGSGPGRFAGPMAIAVGRANGVATDEIYVADSHNRRIVELRDAGDAFAWVREGRVEGDGVTSLDVDHFGNVYAAAPAAGITKLTASLQPLATWSAGVERPRALHVPFVTRTDHRDGRTDWVGQGSAILLEEWSETSGVKLVRLGVDVVDAQARTGDALAARFVLTDRAAVSAEIVDRAGNVVAREDLGVRDAGVQDVTLRPETLSMAQGDYTLRVAARSTYEGSPGGEADVPFSWNGPVVAPNALAVLGAVPNPFGASTQVRFAIPGAGVAAHSLAIYDLAGRLVQRLSSGPLSGGAHAATWDGRDGQGRFVAAGVYLARLEANGATDVHKLVHLR